MWALGYVPHDSRTQPTHGYAATCEEAIASVREPIRAMMRQSGILLLLMLGTMSAKARADDFKLPQDFQGQWCAASHYPASQYNKIDTTVYASANCKEPRAPDDSWIEIRGDGLKAFETECKIISGFATNAAETSLWTWGEVSKKYTVQLQCLIMHEAPIDITMRIYRTRQSANRYDLVIEDITYKDK
jgi:hypothetical protein